MARDRDGGRTPDILLRAIRLPSALALHTTSPSMKSAAKGLLYVLFLAVASVCFGRFRSEYSKGSSREAALDGRAEAALAGRAVADEARDAAPEASTNAQVTGAAIAAGTNANNAPQPPATPTNAVAHAGAPVPKAAAKGNSQAFYLSGFVLGMLGLAGLLAWDVSQFVARKAAHGLGVDFAPIQGDPEYDAAEETWASGDHLGAITQLREFLKRRPNQQHAAIRIAEIYEKDLGNYLAAALELEEVLQKRLPREKWGWTAIHLANLYSGRLNQTDKALEVLHRIVDGYPETTAARKARQRLGLQEPQAAAVADDDDAPVASAPSETAPAELPADDESMPRGFKVKKK